MAGGMRGRGGIPMSRRVQLGSSREPNPAPDPAPDPAPGAADCPARHCWVHDAVDGCADERPGLLLEWRSTAAGWEGRVAYAARLRPDGWLLVEEWLPAWQLTAP